MQHVCLVKGKGSRGACDLNNFLILTLKLMSCMFISANGHKQDQGNVIALKGSTSKLRCEHSKLEPDKLQAAHCHFSARCSRKVSTLMPLAWIFNLECGYLIKLVAGHSHAWMVRVGYLVDGAPRANSCSSTVA